MAAGMLKAVAKPIPKEESVHKRQRQTLEQHQHRQYSQQHGIDVLAKHQHPFWGVPINYRAAEQNVCSY